MNWREFLFSFKGRASRAQYWLMCLLSLPFVIAASWPSNLDYGDAPASSTPRLLFLLPMIWPAFAVTVRRWHDRDKSGWWMLINLIPLVGDLWSLIENGMLRGTAGDNRFGPDPLQQGPAP